MSDRGENRRSEGAPPVWELPPIIEQLLRELAARPSRKSETLLEQLHALVLDAQGDLGLLAALWDLTVKLLDRIARCARIERWRQQRREDRAAQHKASTQRPTQSAAELQSLRENAARLCVALGRLRQLEQRVLLICDWHRQTAAQAATELYGADDPATIAATYRLAAQARQNLLQEWTRGADGDVVDPALFDRFELEAMLEAVEASDSREKEAS